MSLIHKAGMILVVNTISAIVLAGAAFYGVQWLLQFVV